MKCIPAIYPSITGYQGGGQQIVCAFLTIGRLFCRKPGQIRRDCIHPTLDGNLADFIIIPTPWQFRAETSGRSCNAAHSSAPLLKQSPVQNAKETVSVTCLFRSNVGRSRAVQDNLIKISHSAIIVPDRKIKCGFLKIWSLSSKPILINELISDKSIDLFCLNETWLSEDDYVSLTEATPPSQINSNVPHCSGQGDWNLCFLFIHLYTKHRS